jgi:hypothetical protein
MKKILLFLVMAGICTAFDVQAGDCKPENFGEVKTHIEGLGEKFPDHVKAPERGIIVHSEWLFINAGYGYWLILDMDSGELSHIVFITSERYERFASDGRYKFYEKKEIDNGWLELDRKIVLSDESMQSIVCKANYIWSYESQDDIDYKNAIVAGQKAQDAWQKKFDAEQKNLDAWQKKLEKCLRRKCFRTLPPPPELPPPLPPMILEPLATPLDNEFFSRSTDVYEMLFLMDHSFRKSAGGFGVLKGEAEALRKQLEDIARVQVR